MKIKKGDTVQVITGKDKGKKGSVLHAYPKLEKVLVEGVAIAKRHTKSRQQGQSGTIAEAPRPIHVSNVRKIEK